MFAEGDGLKKEGLIGTAATRMAGVTAHADDVKKVAAR
jgi:hypothetical protein